LQLRLHWAAVLRLVEWLRAAGELGGGYAQSLVELALETSPRPLMPDLERLWDLVCDLEDVPEFREQFEDAAHTPSARAYRASL